MKLRLTIAIILSISFLFVNAKPKNKIKDDCIEIVNQWNDYYNSKNINGFKDLFDDRIYYYGSNETISLVIRDIEKQLLNSYEQKIKSEINISFFSNGYIKCAFLKEVHSKGNTKSYPSYLLLKKAFSGYKIVGESDTISDKNMHNEPFLGNEIDDFKSYNYPINLFLIIPACLTLIGIYLIYRERNKTKDIVKNEVIEADNTKVKVEFNSRNNYNPHIDSTETEESKGKDFENFVVERFKKEYFNLIHWRGDKIYNGIYADANKYPDLEYEFKTKSRETKLAVECKWRSSFEAGCLEWAKDYQIMNYNRYQKENNIKVFIFLGVGGRPNYPDELYIIPLDKISNKILYKNSIVQYQRFSKSYFFFDADKMEFSL
jgi:hypothetical protein